MTIREADYFKFAGVESTRFGIRNVNVTSGMQEEPFGSSRSISEISVRGRSKPFFQHVKREPLRFQVSFAFEDAWDKQKIREVCRWLTEQEYYQPLIFTSDNERIFYAMVVDDPVLVHNCLSQGYVNLNFRCNDAYAYSPAAVKTYKWREKSRQINRTSFQQGERQHTILNSSGQITLSPLAVKWNDYPSDMKWEQLK